MNTQSILKSNRFQDLAGKRFGKLFVKEQSANDKNGKTMWLCACDCGSFKVIRGNRLRSGEAVSCGCSHFTHRMSNTPIYKVWSSMLSRCRNKNDAGFANYGGRGVMVCKRWECFELFLADMGERPSAKHSIDRFPNQNGNYEPGNCRWATRTEQNRNKRTNRILVYNGKAATLSEWSIVTGIKRSTISMRLKAGWSVDQTLSIGFKAMGK